MSGRPLIIAIRHFARTCAAIAILAASLLRPLAAEVEQSADLESKIKAVLLLKLVNYVDWPRSAFASSPTIRLGVLGDDPFGPLLEQVMAGESPHGRAIEIQRAAKPNDLAGCHLIFIGANEKPRVSEDRAFFHGKPVLTVSEIDQFARKGGMVGFVRDKNMVRFEINLEACREAGLTVSSRLAATARVVETQK